MVRDNRKAFARIQWDTWSPAGWYSDADFERTAKSFENPDWPEITWQSYSVRWGEADKDPRYADLERLVRQAQSIAVPTVMIHGGSDAATLPASTEGKDHFFSGGYSRYVLPGVSHFPTREVPDAVNQLAVAFLRA
jgi:pimeloyl-ACP methyl ester carboxylesterase